MAVGEFSSVLELAECSMQAYEKVCRPLCQELGMAQTAFDILMFLANNPQYQTARDIVSVRRLKANLVSFHVEKLVQEGFLVRQNVQGDRRKIALVCTEKAQPILKRGRQLQNAFSERLFANMDEEMRRIFSAAMRIIENNLNELLEADEQ